MGASWRPLGDLLTSLGSLLEASWGSLGSLLGALGSSWGCLKSSWETCGALGRPRGSYFGDLGALLGPLGALLGLPIHLASKPPSLQSSRGGMRGAIEYVFRSLRENRWPLASWPGERGGSWLYSGAGFGFRNLLGRFLDSFRSTFGTVRLGCSESSRSSLEDSSERPK